MGELALKNSQAEFMEGLKGFHETEIAGLLFERVERFEDFVLNFKGREQGTLLDLLTYRDSLIRCEGITYELFNERCIEFGVGEAVMITFYQWFSSSELDFANKRLLSKNISNKLIYERISSNTDLSLYKIIL